MSMDGMTMEDKCERLEPCGVMNEFRRLNYGPHAGVLKSAFCARLRASRHSRNCPQWSHRCWKCACSRTHFFVAICHSHLFVNLYQEVLYLHSPSVTVDCRQM